MKQYVPMVVLLTQGQLLRYQGSETIILELAEELARQGATVVIYTNIYDYPIKEEFEKISNVQVFTDEAKLKKKGYKFDLIWVHHQILPRCVINQITKEKERPFVVFNHMSSFFPLEYPYSGEIEKKLADVVLYNSPETKKAIRSRGFDISAESEGVFCNPAPDNFYKAGKSKKYNKKPHKVLFVSNHMQSEVKEAVSLIKNMGIDVKILGINTNDGPVRITPRIIRNADVVVANGKTVQYAILAGTPVYCYDIFGGPGYLKKTNLRRAESFHFSGKLFSFKSAKKIANEIVSQYTEAVKEASVFRNKYKDEYSLPFQLSELFKKLQSIPKNDNKKITKAELGAHLATQELIRIYSLQISDYRLYKEKTEHLTVNTQSIIDENNKLKQELSDLYNSKTWRYTKFARRSLGKLKKINKPK